MTPPTKTQQAQTQRVSTLFQILECQRNIAKVTEQRIELTLLEIAAEARLPVFINDGDGVTRPRHGWRSQTEAWVQRNAQYFNGGSDETH